MAVDLQRHRPALAERARGLFEPPEDLEVWEWAEKKIMIPALESEISGAFSATLTPFIKEPLECFRERGIKQCTFMVATQTFKTLCNMIGVLWYCEQEAARIIWPWDNETNARRFSKERWQRLIAASPALQHLIPEGRDDFNNLEQHLGECTLRLMGSHSPGNIASEPADLVVAEEVDKMASQGDRETDAISNVKSRGKSRSRRRQFYASSPTTEWGLINQSFLEGDQRQYHVPCPHCGEMIVLEWTEQTMRWDKSAKDPTTGAWDMDIVQRTAMYHCQLCEGAITDQMKIGILNDGVWIPTNPRAPSWCRSYQMSSMYSPWESCNWGSLAVYFLNCKAKFNMKDWDNNYMGRPSADVGNSADVEVLQSRRGEYAKPVPDEVAFVTVAVDTQDDRLEAECVGWGEGMENWGIEYKVIQGDPARRHVWKELEAFMFKDRGVPMAMGVVDIGGHHGTEVATFCRKWKHNNVYACQGSRTKWAPIISRVGRTQHIKPRVAIINVGTDNAKNQWLSMFDIEATGSGYCHFPNPEQGYDDEWFRQVAAEEKKTRFKGGEKVVEWVKTRQRNEALDIRVYGLAAYNLLPQAQVTFYIEDRKQRLESAKAPKSAVRAPRKPSGNFATTW